MKKIQYFDIVKQALKITWDNKFLWFFGFLILIGSFQPGMSWDFDGTVQVDQSSQFFANLYANNPGLFAGIILLAIILAVGLLLLQIMGMASIIKAVNNIAIYRQFKIYSILSEVKKYIWKLLILELLIKIGFGVLISLLLVPVLYMFAIKANILGAIFLIIAFLIAIPMIILAYFLRRYAFMFMVLGEMSIRMALEDAYLLIEKNVKESLIAGCISILSGIVVLIGTLFAGMILALVTIPSLIAFLIFAKMGAMVVAILGVSIIALVLFVVLSWYQSFIQVFWVLFFQQISLEKKEEKKKEEIPIEANVPSPEAV